MCRTYPKSDRPRINFHETIHEIVEYPQPSKEDQEASWYSDCEYFEIKESFQYSVFMMDMGKAKEVETNENTTVGLEKHTEEGGWERYEHFRDYRNAVLDEQDQQIKEKTKDPDRIFHAIADTTKRAREKAHQRAHKIEVEICDYLNEARKLLCRKSWHFEPIDTQEETVIAAADLNRKKMKSLENLWDRQNGVRNLNCTANEPATTSPSKKIRPRRLSLPLNMQPSLFDTSAIVEENSPAASDGNNVTGSMPRIGKPSVGINRSKSVDSAGSEQDSVKDSRYATTKTEASKDSRPSLSVRSLRTRVSKLYGKNDSRPKMVDSGKPTEGTSAAVSSRRPPSRAMSDKIAERIELLQEENDRNLLRTPTDRKPPIRNPSSRMPSRAAKAAMKVATITEEQQNGLEAMQRKCELSRNVNALARIPRRKMQDMPEQKLPTSTTPTKRRSAPRRNTSFKIASKLRELQENNARDLRRHSVAVS